MDVVLMIVFGLIAGAIAKMLMPGRDPGGIIVTILLGVAGSLLGGFLFNSLGFGGGERYAGLIGSVIGALILLALYRMFVGRNRKLT
ncbi:MAG TPA: GlsB/YeaQ/YmgE family stress response membrane protein [Burkholderiales bacterium]|nr:GlsB/YeaQ/YmgE family stress response membrane protein [Burkholderiales bacterium]